MVENISIEINCYTHGKRIIDELKSTGAECSHVFKLNRESEFILLEIDFYNYHYLRAFGSEYRKLYEGMTTTMSLTEAINRIKRDNLC